MKTRHLDQNSFVQDQKAPIPLEYFATRLRLVLEGAMEGIRLGIQTIRGSYLVSILENLDIVCLRDLERHNEDCQEVLDQGKHKTRQADFLAQPPQSLASVF
jgi:hypothetical protein